MPGDRQHLCNRATQSGLLWLQALLCTCALLLIPPANAALQPDWLTQEEQQWLAEHPLIRLGVDAGYAPYSFRDEQGDYQGIAVEFTRALLEPLGVELTIEPGLTWPQILDGARDKQLDLILTAVSTPERETFLAFSEIYLPTPLVIMTRDDEASLIDERGLNGRRVALVKKYSSSQQVLADQPGIELIEVGTPLDGLWALASGRADAYVGVLGINVFLANQNGISNLKVAARYGQQRNGQRFAVRKDWAPLATILDKALQAMPPAQAREIFSRWLPLSASGLPEPNPTPVALNAEERAWIAAHPLIRLGVDPGFAPFEFIDSEGNYRGICAEYVQRLNHLLGLNMRIQPNLNWTQAVEGARHRTLDLLPCVGLTQERQGFLAYTEPHLSFPRVIIGRADMPAVASLKRVGSAKVAVQENSSHHGYLRENTPLSPMLYPTAAEAMAAVSRGEADLFVGNEAASAYTIQSHSLNNLRILGRVGKQEQQLYLAVRKDWPELVSILNKGLAAISAEEAATLRGQWVSVRYATPEAQENGAGYTLIVEIVAAALAFVLISLMLLRLLRRHATGDPSRYQFGSGRTRVSGLLLMALFIALVSLLSWLAMDHLRKQELRQAGTSLRTVLNSTKASVDNWVRLHRERLNRLTHTPALRDAVRELLLAPEPSPLSANRIETLIRERLLHEGVEAYALLSIDGTVKLGNDTQAIGNLHPLIRAGQAFEQLRQGRSVLIPPSTQLQQPGAPRRLYFAAPIHSDQGQVRAILALAYDPETSLSRITQIGRLGQTGETFAFNREARLITNSRFNHRLQTAGLISTASNEILNLRLQVPEQDLSDQDLIDNASVKGQRGGQPLTRMAIAATDGYAGEDLHGYTGYLGRQVIGAWLWDHALNIGFATEQSRDEALDTYYRARTTLFALLASTLGLALFGTLFFLLLGERANRALRRARDRLEERVLERTQQLSDSEQRLEMALRGGRMGSWDSDLNSGQTVVNDHWLELLGYAPSEREQLEEPDTLWLKHIHPEDRAEIQRKLNAYHQNPEHAYQLEYRIIGRDGKLRWMLSQGDVVAHNLDGSAARVAGTTMDITERKQLENKLQQLYRAVEQSNATVIITDSDGRIEYANPRLEQITGYPVEEVLGKNPRIFQSGQTEKAIYQELWDRLKSGQEWSGELLNRRKNGELYWESMIASPISNSQGKITHFIAVKEDISERIELVEQLKAARAIADQANRAKSDFLANMSHEIRTPMNAIIGLAHLCMQTDLNSRQRDYLNKLSNAAKSLLGIINDILDFSRIEANKLELESIAFDLEEVLGNVATLIAYPAQEKGLELVFSPAPEITRSLIGDPLRLGQILINLTNNAVKFTEKGEVNVAVDVVDQSTEQVQLRFAVKDSGIGISPAQQQQLFAAFSQADSSTSRRFGGSGLGLAISKRLINLMGGEIGVDSQPGQGSTFYFTCTLACRHQPRPRLHPGKLLEGMRILVVDDNATVRTSLQQMLAAQSFVVDTAASGEDALTHLKDKTYQLVFMDWNMPGMNGIEAARRIREAEHPAPMVVMITAYGRESLMQEAEAAGISNFLVKPVTPSMLFDTIMDLFGQRVYQQLREEPSERSESPPLQGRRILLVEDNAFNQLVAKELLQQQGLEVICAENGQQALDLAAQHPVDLVLMDVQMPVMDGYETTRKLRERPATRALPIIAMTAGAMQGDRERCFEAGMDDYLSKPIDPDHLHRVIQQWLATDAQTVRSDQPPLPPVPGIDTREGLRLAGGNRTNYLRLLALFAEQEVDLPGRINAAITENDRPLARRLAHNLKGTSATIGAMRLAESAATLEQLIVNEAPAEQLRRQLEELKLTLHEPIAGLRELLDELHDRHPPKPRLDAYTLPAADYEQQLRQLRDLVHKQEYAALAALEKLQHGVPEALTEKVDLVRHALQQFDFDLAAGLLDTLIRNTVVEPKPPADQTDIHEEGRST